MFIRPKFFWRVGDRINGAPMYLIKNFVVIYLKDNKLPQLTIKFPSKTEMTGMGRRESKRHLIADYHGLSFNLRDLSE